MEEINVEELKKDREFLDNLKALEQEMVAEGSVDKAYQLLSAKIVLGVEGEELDEIFTFIVKNAIDKFSEKFEKGELFDLSNPEELASFRALYELAMQNYAENITDRAGELFFSLSKMANDAELQDAMIVHYGALKSGYSFDDFMEKLAVVPIEQLNNKNPKSNFITNFVQPIDIMIEMFDKEIKKGEEKFQSLGS
jgi:hypothetical protein